MISTCGPFRFTSNFDSGNFLKTEILETRRPAAGHGIDYEVNLWTRPDCHGTAFENGNRTWFHFGIRGGKSSANLKLNILNLNKQVKLFHQGMQPVFRILPERPYWERVPDRLIVNETLDHICSISFRQRLPEDTKNSTLYIAFSYPFSYAELCEWLNRLDTIFDQPTPPEFNFDRIKLPLPKQAESSLVAAAALPVENEIYYHRECACYSLEGRAVELITVTSLYGMSSEREERLMNLFPDTSQSRPYRFPSKKVVFLSARVHPGETPSTFVLNGFFKFVLERNDPRAIVLRRLFVFKFMPMLNPDGVARGHYRTDPRGVNLNRVYLNPSPHLHPSIYAARKLLLYYHLGHDSPDDYEYPSENQATPEESAVTKLIKEENDKSSNLGSSSSGTCAKICIQSSSTKMCSDDPNANTAKPGSKSNVSVVDSAISSSGENIKSTSGSNTSKYTFVLSDANSLCAGCTISPYEKNKCKTDVRRNDIVDKKKKRKGRLGSAVHKKSSQDLASKELEIASSSSSGVSKSDVTSRIMIENEMDSLPGTGGMMDAVTMENVDMETDSHQCAFEACDEDSVLYTNEFMSLDALDGVSSPSKAATVQSKAVLSEKKEEAGSSNQSLTKQQKVTTKSSKALGAELFGLTVRKRVKSPDMKLKEKAFQKDPFGTPTSITSRGTYKVQHRFNESPSGLFLYVDMHGHATKRGIFMYGNHFPDAATQAECMLLPRLMAMNCPNFDFAACNFTERLMNMKDRRDGASREGSGRVACLKLTGLVRSYTLECNYNTGRLVNPIVTRPTSYGFSDPPSPINIHHAPKFTPELFEGSGRALAESVLDLTGHNPWSRLNYTEFKTLEGMGRWLSNRLLHSPEYSQTRRASLSSNISKDKIIPKKSSSSSAVGISPNPASPRPSANIKNIKKRSPKKRTSTKVLVELHPHRTATASSSSKRGSETRVPIITPAGIPRNVSTPSRRSSLPNRINCYAVPPSTRTTEPVRRDPPAR